MAAPYVNIELGGKKKLRYRHNDIADLEQQTGKTFQEFIVSMQFNGIRLMLHYGLRWMTELKMTPQKAGDLIQDHWISDGKTLDQLADVITEALKAGGIIKMPEAKDSDSADGGDEGNAQPPEAA